MNKLVEYWYFTFPQHQEKLKNKYVKIAGSHQETRNKMFKKYGNNWAFQYRADDFKDQIEEFNLTELECIE